MAGQTVVVVGAGPAGVRAAERLVAAGVRPIVVDEAERAGGQIYRRPHSGLERSYETLYGFEAGRAKALHDAFDALRPAIDHRPMTLAYAVDGRRLFLNAGGRITEVRFDALLLATGATDRLLPVRGWTLPGVFSLGGAQVALKAQAATIGRRPVLMGTGPLLTLVAYQYVKAGTKPAAVLDVSPFRARLAALPQLASRAGVLAKGLYYVAQLRRLGVPLWTGVTPLAIEGSGRVSRVIWTDDGGQRRETDCDAVGLGFGLRSETQLADLAGARFAFRASAGQWLPVQDDAGRTTVERVYVAGDGAGVNGADAAEIQGRLAAIALLDDLGITRSAEEEKRLRRQHARMRRFTAGLERAFLWPASLAAATADETLVCRCEAITAGELRRSVRDLDARELNRAKSFVRVGMGRCQGRFCGAAAGEILAAALGVATRDAGRLRGQSPVKPLSISAERNS
ncbi:MAG: NAD(P)/FAD-dependent oxidoreductase [Hyphomicrobiaceae bacterium]